MKRILAAAALCLALAGPAFAQTQIPGGGSSVTASSTITPSGASNTVTLGTVAQRVGLFIDDYGGDNTGATYSDTALTNVHTACVALGGCTVRFRPGTYKFQNQFVFPNDGTGVDGSGGSKQVPIVWIGAATVNDTSSYGSRNLAGGTVLTFEYQGAGVAKIETLGSGNLAFHNLTIKSGGTVSGTDPALFVTTNTNVQFDNSVTWIGQGTNSPTACTITTDAIVLGGNQTTPHYGTTDTSNFQGYATRITGGNFYNIRHAVRFQNDANSVTVDGLNIWTGCSATANDAPIIIGLSTSSTSAISNDIVGRILVEGSNWPYAVHALAPSQGAQIGPIFSYDGTATTLGVVLVDNTVSGVQVWEGLTPVSKPTVTDNNAAVLGGGTTVFAKPNSGNYSTLTSFISGTAALPDKIGYLTVNGGSGAFLVQPDNSTSACGAAKLLTLTNRPSDGPVEVMSFQCDGKINLGNFSQSGNVTNALSTGANWFANGKSWGFNGTSGGNMLIDSGTGGSDVKVKGFTFSLFDHTNSRRMVASANACSTSKIGWDIGATAGQTCLYQDSSSALATNVAFKSTALVATGAAPTLTGTCTTGSQVGGNTAGAFAATCTAQTVIVTFATTAPNGWVCDFNDLTTPADSIKQTAYSTTSCTATGTTVAADVITFHAVAF